MFDCLGCSCSAAVVPLCGAEHNKRLLCGGTSEAAGALSCLGCLYQIVEGDLMQQVIVGLCTTHTAGGALLRTTGR